MQRRQSDDQAMPWPARHSANFPTWLRIAAILWLCLWMPAYAEAWGWENFLHFCDIALILTCLGFVFQNRLLLSTQTLGCLAICLIWTLDLSCRLLLGHHLIGGTEYMFDRTIPEWLRVLSLYHLVLPILLLWILFRIGYDSRAWRVQSAIAAAVLIASRCVAPDQNLNSAFTDPVFHRAWGPAPVHLAAMYVLLIVVLYLPVHRLLLRYFPLRRSA